MPLQHRDSPYPHWEFSDGGSGDRLRLVPERGGLISGWQCQGRERLYLDVARFADPSLSVRGGIPVLFPICGGLPNNQLTLPQGRFQLAQHGFARDLPWELTPLADGRGIALELRDQPRTLAAFPFPFRLQLEARLAPAALELIVRLENRGDQPLPFSFGLHPYFAVSALENVRLEGLPPQAFDHHTMAEADTAAQLERIGQGIDLLTRPSGPVRLLDGADGGGIELQPSHPWDLVVLWSEPPRPMVCLEPWTGPRQALLSGDRRLVVEGGGSMQLETRFVCLPGGG
jgi:galactose mutarotase-like enzyme